MKENTRILDLTFNIEWFSLGWFPFKNFSSAFEQDWAGLVFFLMQYIFVLFCTVNSRANQNYTTYYSQSLSLFNLLPHFLGVKSTVKY